MTLHDHVTEAKARLGGAGIAMPEAGLDAELLARHVLQWDRATFVVHRHASTPSSFEADYAELITRRAAREPVARIRGSQEFWGLDLEVSPATLIPRPETELVIEQLLADRESLPNEPTVVDVGTGTGCLAIAVARELPAARIIATDVSHAALQVARRNARRHGLAERIGCVCTNLLDSVTAGIDVVVSNPPYVPTADVSRLEPEVSDHEPRLALIGGADGLDVIRRLLLQAAALLKPGGRLLVEFGIDQLPALARLVDANPDLRLARVARDLQGLPRVAVVERRAPATGERDEETR